MDPQIKGALVGSLATVSILTSFYIMSKNSKSSETPVHKTLPHSSSIHLRKIEQHLADEDGRCVLLGDVGGTNIRLVLSTIYLHDKNKREVIKEANVNSQTVSSFEEAVVNFLKVSNKLSLSWVWVGVDGKIRQKRYVQTEVNGIII
jgi:hypothetical protein